jgi:hypothetical protein
LSSWGKWLGALLLLLTACSGTRLSGDCVETRKIEHTLQCEREGKIETFRIPLPE